MRGRAGWGERATVSGGRRIRGAPTQKSDRVSYGRPHAGADYKLIVIESDMRRDGTVVLVDGNGETRLPRWIEVVMFVADPRGEVESMSGLPLQESPVGARESGSSARIVEEGSLQRQTANSSLFAAA